MRKCIRCKTEMIENCGIKVDGTGYGFTIADSQKILGKRMGKPKAAVCPNCGEVSIYLEDVQAYLDKKDK